MNKHPIPRVAGIDSILDEFDHEMKRCGVVGESRTTKLAYLALTSRLFDRPISLLIKGPSSGGKSWSLKQVLKFFPESAYILRSSMTPKAIAYSTEDLRHRTLVVAEADGISDGTGAYLIRTLLSEGCVTHEVVEQRDGEFGTRTVRKEGPTNLLMTTTKLSIHAENETRALSVPINDGSEQTRNIMRQIARADSRSKPDLSEWVIYQEWIAARPCEVVLPFAEFLVDLMPPISIRLRRDISLLLGLIQAHALLHQIHRPVTSDGRIEATLDDYRIVRALVGDLIAEGIDAAVPMTVRETVRAVQAAGGRVEGLSDLAATLGCDKSALSRRVSRCVRDGYLRRTGGPGAKCTLTLGEPMPADTVLLPTVEDLAAAMERCTVARESERGASPLKAEVFDDRR